jgi:Ca2+-transporting ATPase
LLLLFVLFENFQTLNCRSEYHSIFARQPFANPFLIAGIVAAQSLQIVAMHFPALQDLLGLSPVSPAQWAVLVSVAATVAVVMEVDKYLTRQPGGSTSPDPVQTSWGLR